MIFTEPTNPKFPLGTVVVTAGAKASLPVGGLNDLLQRHASGDWGDLGAGDKQMNEDAITTSEDRVFSMYMVAGTKFYVITEWDRSVTTILRADEY